MYLLILDSMSSPRRRMQFTFHNVSINSNFKLSLDIDRPHLHSIMYLLILLSYVTVYSLPHLFTFHNVSINSLLYFVQLILTNLFTFHNVSINSRPPTTIISSIGFLLFLSTSFYSPHLISIFLL